LEVISKTYKNLVKEGGPWLFRIFENLISGYINLSQSDNSIYKKRAEKYKEMIFPICLLSFSSIFFFYGKNFKKRWFKIIKFFRLNFNLYFWISLIFSPIVVIALIFIYFFGFLTFWLNPYGDQPEKSKTEYNF